MTINPFQMLYFTLDADGHGDPGDVLHTFTYCPTLKDCEFEPGMVEQAYYDNSLVYLGTPTYKLVWEYMTPTDAEFLWSIYSSQISSQSPISIPIPDPDGEGWYTTSAYIGMPEGELTGELLENFSILVYNVHEASAKSAASSPAGNIWGGIKGGQQYEVGGDYGIVGTAWRF